MLRCTDASEGRSATTSIDAITVPARGGGGGSGPSPMSVVAALDIVARALRVDEHEPDRGVAARQGLRVYAAGGIGGGSTAPLLRPNVFDLARELGERAAAVCWKSRESCSA